MERTHRRAARPRRRRLPPVRHAGHVLPRRHVDRAVRAGGCGTADLPRRLGGRVLLSEAAFLTMPPDDRRDPNVPDRRTLLPRKGGRRENDPPEDVDRLLARADATLYEAER